MVDEREAERQIGAAALRERPALLAAPTEARRGVGDVPDQWEDCLRALRAKRAVERFDDRRVRVDRDRVVGLGGRDPRVPPVVAAEVPEEPAAPEPGRLADEGFLGCGVGVVVRVRLAVARPRRPPRLPSQPLHELPKLPCVRADQLGVEARLLQVALDLPVGVPPLEPGMEDDVRQDTATEAVAEAHERAHLRRLDPLQRAAEPRLERHALVGLEHERIEDERAELAIAGPRLAFAQPLERADVDEDRLRARAIARCRAKRP